MLPPPTTTFSRLRSLLSNSAGTLSRFLTVNVNLTLAGTAISPTSNFRSLMVRTKCVSSAWPMMGVTTPATMTRASSLRLTMERSLVRMSCICNKSTLLPIVAALNPQKPARRAMQPLDAGLRDQHQLAGLNAGSRGRSDDIGLDHHGHPGGKGQSRQRPRRRPRAAAQHGWQIAAAVAMQQVVAGGEAGLLDDAGRSDDLRRRGAGAQDRSDGVERAIGGVVQIAIERRRLPPDREAAQHLPRIVPERGADLGQDDVARLDAAARGELRRNEDLGRRHRRHTEIMDLILAAPGQVGALDDGAELALAQAGPQRTLQCRDCQIGEMGRDAQPIDLLGRFDQAQLGVGGIEVGDPAEFRGKLAMRPEAQGPDDADAIAPGTARLQGRDGAADTGFAAPFELGFGQAVCLRHVVVELDEERDG